MLIGVQLRLLQRICRTIIIEMVSFGEITFDATFIIYHVCKKKKKKREWKKGVTLRFILEWNFHRKKKKEEKEILFFLSIELKIVRTKKYCAIVCSSVNRDKKKIDFISIVPMARNTALIDWIVRSASLMRSFLLRSTS